MQNRGFNREVITTIERFIVYELYNIFSKELSLIALRYFSYKKYIKLLFNTNTKMKVVLKNTE